MNSSTIAAIVLAALLIIILMSVVIVTLHLYPKRQLFEDAPDTRQPSGGSSNYSDPRSLSSESRVEGRRERDLERNIGVEQYRRIIDVHPMEIVDNEAIRPTPAKETLGTRYEDMKPGTPPFRGDSSSEHADKPADIKIPVSAYATASSSPTSPRHDSSEENQDVETRTAKTSLISRFREEFNGLNRERRRSDSALMEAHTWHEGGEMQFNNLFPKTHSDPGLSR